MTDPWDRFVRTVGRAEVAGYFERGPDDGRSGRATWFNNPGEQLSLHRDTSLEELSHLTGRYLQRHTRGGVLGYVGFDAVGLFEPALRAFPPGSPFPLGELAFVPRLEEALVPRRSRTAPPPVRRRRPLADSLSAQRFGGAVSRLVREIRNGEAFQVVLAHRRAWPRPSDLLERAGRLRRCERFTFFYYLRFGDREIVGASPESVAELRVSRAYVDPIAGTLPSRRPAGRRPLRVDPKELAEHRMLVDLARNDLGGISRPGTVGLAWTERRTRYARLEHLVSRVGGSVRRGVGPWELLAATFPAGTVSGAPKIRATELLRREERTWRGPYAGAVGCLRPGRHAAWALAIRTAFAAKDRIYTAAGAGIVHRSAPQREYEETLTKLAVVEAVLGDRGT